MELHGTTHDGLPWRRRLSPHARHLHITPRRLASLDLSPLASCHRLTRLSLPDPALRLLNFDVIARLPRLKSLEVGLHPHVDPSPLGHLACLRSLSLHCGGRAHLDPGVVSSSRALVYLSIEGGAFHTLDLAPLTRAPGLTVLSISRGALHRLDLTPLSRCPRLEALSLFDLPMLEVDLAPLHAHPARPLRWLNVEGVLRATLPRHLHPDAIALHLRGHVARA